MDRRTYLKTVSITGAGLGLAGCMDAVSDAVDDSPTATPAPFSLVEDPWAEFDESSTRTTDSVSARGTLQAGEYTYWRSRSGRDPTMAYSVTVAGPNGIDVFPMPGGGFDVYQQRREGPYYDELVAVEVTEHSDSADIPGGIAHLVLDNTRVFGGYPNGEITFELSATVSWEP